MVSLLSRHHFNFSVCDPWAVGEKDKMLCLQKTCDLIGSLRTFPVSSQEKEQNNFLVGNLKIVNLCGHVIIFPSPFPFPLLKGQVEIHLKGLFVCKISVP